MRLTIEAAILRVSEGRCHYCSAEAQCSDHVVPISVGGKDALGNLVPSCNLCNLRKGSKRLSCAQEEQALALAVNLAMKVRDAGWKVRAVRGKPKKPRPFVNSVDEDFKALRRAMRNPAKAAKIRANIHKLMELA